MSEEVQIQFHRRQVTGENPVVRSQVQVYLGPSRIQSTCRSSSPNVGLSSRGARSNSRAGSDKLFDKRWRHVLKRSQGRTWSFAGDVIAKTEGSGKVGKEELYLRFDKFARGQWGALLQEAEVALRKKVNETPHSGHPRPMGRGSLSESEVGRVVEGSVVFDGRVVGPWDR